MVYCAVCNYVVCDSADFLLFVPADDCSNFGICGWLMLL